MKKIINNILIIIFVACLIKFIIYLNKNEVLAQATKNYSSDVQLMARAINRRGKRRKL